MEQRGKQMADTKYKRKACTRVRISGISGYVRKAGSRGCRFAFQAVQNHHEPSAIAGRAAYSVMPRSSAHLSSSSIAGLRFSASQLMEKSKVSGV